MKTSLRINALAVAMILAGISSLPAGEWSWRLPVNRYQNLDFEKRLMIDKAVEAYIKAEDSARQNKSVPDVQIPTFRAASAEWQKYTVQYEFDPDATDDINAYVLFMKGMSFKGARDRNKAIDAFREVCELYPEQSWIVPAAKFMIGDCQYANGENTRARGTFLDMIDEYPEHPLAARANNRVANIYLYLQKLPEATKYWGYASNPIFKDTATSDWREAVETLPQVLAIVGNWKELTNRVYAEKDTKTAKDIMNGIIWIEDLIIGRRWQWGQKWYDGFYVDKPTEKSKAYKEFDKGFSKWHEEQKAAFTAGGNEWEYYKRAFSYRKTVDVKEAKKLIPDITKNLKALEDKVRPDKARELGILLADARLFEEAHSVESMIPDMIKRLWLSYEIDRRAGQWDACILSLEQIIASKDPEVSLSGKKTLAWLYKDCVRDYEKALKIYLDISVPPGTLWDIQHCYRRLGEKAKCFATLQDLSFFPDQAARATWTMAEYYREDGEKEKAIALYRRLLSQPEWKKTGESSQAHQRLEAWGIATGGGVVETVR